MSKRLSHARSIADKAAYEKYLRETECHASATGAACLARLTPVTDAERNRVKDAAINVLTYLLKYKCTSADLGYPVENMRDLLLALGVPASMIEDWFHAIGVALRATGK